MLLCQFLQKKDPSYKEVKEDTAWSMAKFNDYINTHDAAAKGLDHDWVYNTMTKQMQRIMLHCFNSVKHKLQCKVGYFDLYGLDFMIDTDMKVWLIEVNVNPALHTNCEALREVIPGIVEETLHVSIEAFEKSRKNQPLMPLQSLKGFQVLHCGTPLFNVAPRQTRSVSPAKGENPERVRVTQTAHAHSRHTSLPRPLPRMSVSTTQVQVSSNVGSSQNAPSGGAKASQTSLPDISHSNTNANQSTHGKPLTTTSQPAAVRNVTTTTNQQPVSAKAPAASGQSGGKPSTAPTSTTPKMGPTSTTPKTSPTSTVTTSTVTTPKMGPSSMVTTPKTGPTYTVTTPKTGPTSTVTTLKTGPTSTVTTPKTGPTSTVTTPKTGPTSTVTTPKAAPTSTIPTPKTGPSSTVPTPKAGPSAGSLKAGPAAASSGLGPRPSVPPAPGRQPLPTADVKVGGDDVRLKMTHGGSATTRKHREKPDRGN
ncbi:hypothetical protein ACOMHN_033905 [Nucella lapillus]